MATVRGEVTAWEQKKYVAVSKILNSFVTIFKEIQHFWKIEVVKKLS